MDNAIKEVSKQGEISLQFVRLNEKKEQLHDRIGILFDRLQEVMRQPEKPSQGATPEEAFSCQLAKDLLAICHTTDSDIDKVNEIIDRLEL